MGTQVQAALCAVRDDHLTTVQPRAAGDPQVVGNGLAQHRLSHGARVVELLGAQASPGTVQQTAPQRDWKRLQRGHPGRKRQRGFRRLARGDCHGAPGQACAQGPGGVRHWRRHTGHLGHHSAAPVGHHQPLGCQLVVGVEHGVARQPQLQRQCAAGRQACAHRQRSIADGAAQPLVKPALARTLRRALFADPAAQQQLVIHGFCGSKKYPLCGSFHGSSNVLDSEHLSCTDAHP